MTSAAPLETALPTIIVCGLASLDAALVAHDPEIVVSLIGPGEVDRLATSRCQHLHLVCADIEVDRGRYRAPTSAHVQRLLDAADGWTRSRPLLFHCFGGRSRSWAAAFVVLCRISEEAEDAIAARILALAPWARPHRGIVTMADAIMRRDGRMRKAMLEMHRSMHGSQDIEGSHSTVVIEVARA